jgi:hypothetical protein
MTKDEIIEMVMQIGGCDRPEYDSPALKIFEAFAKLVAAKEREIWERRVARLQSLMDLREQQPNKPCCIAEREACAEICKKHADVYSMFEQNPTAKSAWAACIDNLDAIQARGEA